MKNVLENPILSLIARIVLGGIFILAAVGKIADPALFAKEIANYQILPTIFVNLSAITLPWIELAIGFFLIAGVRLKANSFGAGFLLAVFVVAVAIAMMKGLNINCGCYSQAAYQEVGIKKVLENLGLFILSVYIFKYPVRRFTIERLIEMELLEENETKA